MRSDFILRQLVLGLGSVSLGNVVVDLAHFVELLWVILEYPPEKLDVPLD